MGCTLFSLLRLPRRVDELEDIKARVEALGRDVAELKKNVGVVAEKVDKLARAFEELSREVNKLSDVVGFMVEDVARSMLPLWLGKHMGLKVDSLDRAFFQVGDKVLEVDLYGEALDSTGGKLVIIGEVKSRIHGVDIKAFHEKATNLASTLGEGRRVLLVVFGLYAHPTAIVEAEKRGIILVTPYNTLWAKVTREDVIQNT
jgi:alkanesulfonate monooxygenase SsuD/methylene tetrahydromethanopterin reductase-like flavin-dependent oxidoreductase (luciferase family)